MTTPFREGGGGAEGEVERRDVEDHSSSIITVRYLFFFSCRVLRQYRRCHCPIWLCVRRARVIRHPNRARADYKGFTRSSFRSKRGLVEEYFWG